MSKFWKATSVNATNGSAIVTVNTGDDVALVRANSLLQIGALQVVEVKTVNTSNQTIELFDAWNGGSISGQSAIAAPSAAELAQAIDDVRTLTAAYEGIADDVSVNPSADSIVKRTSAGRVKTATPSAADDAVNLGYVGTAATKNVGTSTGNVLEVGAFGIGGTSSTFTDWNAVPQSYGGFFNINTTTATNKPAGMPDLSFCHVIAFGDNNDSYIVKKTNSNRVVLLSRLGDGTWKYEAELYHSGNTNFNEFSIPAGKAMMGVARYAGEVHVNFPLVSYNMPTGITTTGTFKIVDLTDSTTVATNISPAIVGADSTSKNGILKFTSIGTYVAGRNYRVEAETSASVSFNF